MGSAVGESFSRSHGCTSYSLHPPLQCWVPYRSLAAPMWPSVDSLPLASRSSSCNDVTPCLALSLSCTTSPFACRKCAFKSFGFRNPRVLLIGYSWVWVEIIRHSPLSECLSFDCQPWLDLTYRKDYYSVTHVSAPICCPFNIGFPYRANTPGYR